MVKLLLDRGAKIDAKTRVRAQFVYMLILFLIPSEVRILLIPSHWLNPGFTLTSLVIV